MSHTWKNVSHLEIFSPLKKWVTLEKIGYTWKDGSHHGLLITLERMGRTRKNGSHLEKWVSLGKMGHTWKNGSHLKKRVSLGKGVLHVQKLVTLKK